MKTAKIEVSYSIQMNNENLTYITAVVPESLRDKFEAEFIEACENGYRDIFEMFVGEKISKLEEGENI